MPEARLAVRNGLYLGLVITLPVSVWLAGSAALALQSGAAVAADSRELVAVLALLQVFSLVLFTPRLQRYDTSRARYCGLGMLLLTPLPLYVIAWAMTALDAWLLLRLGLALTALAVLMGGLYRAFVTLLPQGWSRAAAIPLCQWGLCLLAWSQRAGWLQWLGLQG